MKRADAPCMCTASPCECNTPRSCELGTCWAEPLGEACDHWKREAERARESEKQFSETAIAQMRRADDFLRERNEAWAEIERLRRALRCQP